jgi:DUF1680 family protein
LKKTWQKGDVVSFNIPLETRRVIAIDSIKEDRNQVALQRGPLIYCFESVDNNGSVSNIIVPDTTSFFPRFEKDKLGGVMILQGTAPIAEVAGDGLSIKSEDKQIIAIPYFAWANRGQGQMKTWVPRKITAIKLESSP